MSRRQTKVCRECLMVRPDSGHDPCIEDLKFVIFACCGHGVQEGYALLRNNIVLRWKRHISRATIERYIARAKAGKPLPAAVTVSSGGDYWEGLTDEEIDAQRQLWGKSRQLSPCWVKPDRVGVQPANS